MTAYREFPPTRWSVVLVAQEKGASAEAAAALETICRMYWYPLYGYARRCGRSAHDAQDITQGFFEQLLAKEWLDDVDQEKGRLRTFLIVALKRYMQNDRRRQQATRRGGKVPHIPIDAELAESKFAADPGAEDAERAFDRQWAMTLLELTLEQVSTEYAGKEADFEALKPCLLASRGMVNYGKLASKLAISEGAARVAVHRLRKHFREIYRQEILQTLPDAADVDAEMRHLAAAVQA